jgi:uncharacterized protein
VKLEAPSSELDLGGGEVAFEGPVRAQLNIVRHQDNLLIKGVAEATASGECARCLDGFQIGVRADLTVYAERAPDGGTRGLDRELEHDHYLSFHDGISLDLGEEVREALLLALPIQPLCRSECRGLCAGCGANLNHEACSCATGAERPSSPAANP